MHLVKVWILPIKGSYRFQLQMLPVYTDLYVFFSVALLNMKEDPEDPRGSWVTALWGCHCLGRDLYPAGSAGTGAELLVRDPNHGSGPRLWVWLWLWLQVWLPVLCGAWYDEQAFHSAVGSGSFLRWAARRMFVAKLWWRFWRQNASSTRPRGCREAASQGMMGLRPFSSQDVWLVGGAVEARAWGFWEAADTDCWPMDGTLARGERE